MSAYAIYDMYAYGSIILTIYGDFCVITVTS